ncbi:hypothetical protein F2Q70_00037790 [Brassica cretica]|uniref:Cationic amino acid transporter C-terminal domain-containing protein n=1 Tax=Brassica cretica TaxID=69181 RepID=A0A8S9JU54_BRACR|nr:hypothetical protein F2Q70_00037790 [Brassica cretica]
MMTPKVEMIGSNKTIRNDPMLILDLVILVMERLSFVDFHRARCVSSVWYSASKSCRMRQANPWLVLFPADVLHLPLESIDDSCKLFDPVDNKTYTVRDLGSDILRTSCLASYNSWFLMLDRKTRFYLLNMLTRERIHLPSLDSMESTEGFLCPFVPYLPVLCILINTYLIINIGAGTWIRVLIWLLIGSLIYLFYGRSHSLLNNAGYVPTTCTGETTDRLV